MKKCISLVLCLVMLLSAFSVCGVVAGAADAKKVMYVTNTSLDDELVKCTVYLKKKVPIYGGVVVKVAFDTNALELVDGGSYNITDKYGDETPNVPGMYVNDFVDGKNGEYSIGFLNSNLNESYNTGSKDKAFMQVTFRVIDPERDATGIEFYCVEFSSPDEDLNISHNSENPQLFYKTIGKTVFKNVETLADGLKISWKPTEGVSYYNFYKKNDAGKWETVGKKLPSTQTSYIDTELSNDETGTYAVKSYNKEGFCATDYSTISAVFVKATPKLSAALLTNGVKVSWSAVSGADYYRLYRRVVNDDGTKGAWTTAVKKTTAKSYTDTSVKSGVKYEYTLRTFVGSKYSAISKLASVNYYAAPTVKITGVSGGVKLTWNKIEGAETYRIYRKYNGATSWTVIADVSADTLQFTDKAPKSCRKIFYTVRAFTKNDGSSKFIEKSIAYVAVPQLTSITNTKNGVQVKWTADANAEGYRVYRKAAGAAKWTYVTTVKTAYYNDKNVKSGTDYTYTVRAVYGKYYSNYESGLSIKYLATPKLTKASNVSAGIQVKWADIAGETGYRVYRKTGSGSWQLIGTTKNCHFTDKNVTDGTTYSYTVRAYNGKTLSAYNTSGLKIKCS